MVYEVPDPGLGPDWRAKKKHRTSPLVFPKPSYLFLSWWLLPSSPSLTFTITRVQVLLASVALVIVSHDSRHLINIIWKKGGGQLDSSS